LILWEVSVTVASEVPTRTCFLALVYPCFETLRKQKKEGWFEKG